MSDITVGTCSLCGGRVVIPATWMGLNPPIPTCQGCGATKVQPHGNVIPMEKVPTSLGWPKDKP